MPDQTGRIDHQLATDITDHALYLGALAFVGLVGLLLTILVLDDLRRRRRKRRAWDCTRLVEEAQRSDGIEEGFRRGWHG